MKTPHNILERSDAFLTPEQRFARHLTWSRGRVFDPLAFKIMLALGAVAGGLVAYVLR